MHEEQEHEREGEGRRVDIEGDGRLLALLGEPLRRALAETRRLYRVRIEGVGRCGETMVAVNGMKGRLPLLFDQEELEPGYVASVVKRAVERFAL